MVWKRGDWKIIDDESGRTIYASEARQSWDGSLRHYSQYETRQPQEFVRAKNDPKPLLKVRPDRAYPTPDLIVPLTVGETNVLTRTGPATHLFDFGILGGDPGIGEMTIEASATQGPFIVR